MSSPILLSASGSSRWRSSVRRHKGFYTGGTSRVKDWLDDFIAVKLRDYAAKRSDPSLDLGSNMSPHLQFGQISPLYIALRVQNAIGVGIEAKDTYLEKLSIRRELSMNFVYHNPAYDAYRCLPDWARATLEKHRKDKRDYVYTSRELEEARTHDPFWNAAM